MTELILGLSILIGFVLSIHGLYLLFTNRDNLIGFIGLEIDKKQIKVIFLFAIAAFLLFAALIGLNFQRNLISIETAFDLIALFKTVPSEMAAVIFEELIFRVLIFSSLFYFTKNKNLTLAVTSMLFSFAHFPDNFIEILSYFLGGIMYGYAFLKFQSIWLPIAIHFFWNFIQGPVLGFPVSGMNLEGMLSLEIIPDVFFNGGDQGPEGSVLGILLRVVIVILVFILPFSKINPAFLKFKEPGSESGQKKRN